jgi:hypothetical protein
MPWVRRKKAKAARVVADTAKTPAPGPARVALGNGAFLTTSAAMGVVYETPADPRPLALDLRPEAPGWGRHGR